MRTNFDEMASNVSDGVTEKDVSEQRLCISLSRITVCFTYNDVWRVEEYKDPERNRFSWLSHITVNHACAVNNRL